MSIKYYLEKFNKPCQFRLIKFGL